VFKARVSLEGFTTGSFISAEARYLSSRRTVVGPVVPGRTLINVTLNQPIARRLEIVATVRNLFDVDYADPASDQHLQVTIPQNGITARVGLLWRFGGN
jgi:outer membrane receptor protein involved in Fe transport